MNYEKEYKKLKADISKAYLYAQTDSTKAVLETILPELKEIEDERISREITEFLVDFNNGEYERPNENTIDSWLSWLEKQGEHAKFRDSIQVGDQVTRNEDGELFNLSQLKRVAKKDEKQGEQKATIIIPKFRVGDEIKTTNEAPLTITKITDSGYWSEDLFICSFENSAKWELVEQKPAWSKRG